MPREDWTRFVGLVLVLVPAAVAAPWELHPAAETWRQERRVIDLHQHVNSTTQHLARAVRILDGAGVGVAINLSGGAVTRGRDGAVSEFERNRQLAETLYPGRFLLYMNLDYTGWDEPGFSERAVRQIEEGYRLGAAGLKEFKRLGLYLRDGQGQLIRVDDSKLDPVWKRCGELHMPVSIHVADPKAFWEPYEPQNERWKELKDHKNWWFGDPNKFPPWKELLEALNRVMARHPKTTFVCVHFGNNAEELAWVDEALRRHPNMMVDLAARIPEIGRHPPERVRELFIRYQERVFFATDFQVYDRLILGSSGNEPPPTDADAEVFFAKEWRWLETRDRGWEHMTPIQGDWPISSIGLPEPVLRKVYFDNARRLLARSLPAPVLEARRISQELPWEAAIKDARWHVARPVEVDQASLTGAVRPELSTRVRALWSDQFLYLRYECPFTRLTYFEPGAAGRERYDLGQEGVSLWDRDVVEAFIGSDLSQPKHYAEFEVAPTNERLDVLVPGLPKKDFAWDSRFESVVQVDRKAKRWDCVMRIPLDALAANKPAPGGEWRLNLFRCDRANRAALAWRPTLVGSFHVPDRFGILRFLE